MILNIIYIIIMFVHSKWILSSLNIFKQKNIDNSTLYFFKFESQSLVSLTW